MVRVPFYNLYANKDAVLFLYGLTSTLSALVDSRNITTWKNLFLTFKGQQNKTSCCLRLSFNDKCYKKDHRFALFGTPLGPGP